MNYRLLFLKTTFFNVWCELCLEWEETTFRSFNDVCEEYLEINYKCINNRVISFDYFSYFMMNMKKIAKLEILGKGTYGQVFKVEEYFKGMKRKINFAINKIKF